MRKTHISIVVAAALLLAVSPTAAVQNGTPTTNYPSDGFAFISFGTTCDPFNTSTGCNAVLISDGSSKPIAAVTTGLCGQGIIETRDFFEEFFGSATAWLSFNATDPYECDPGDATAFKNALRIDTVVLHPQYDNHSRFGEALDRHDLAALLLEARAGVSLSAATLPPLGYLNTLPESQSLTSASFAPSNLTTIQIFSQGRFGLKAFDIFDVQRRMAPVLNVAVSSTTHVTKIDFALDDHSCYSFFDTGGGNYTSNTQLASLSRIDSINCSPVSLGQRLDTQDAIDFLAPYAP